jgi:large repetitive protein
MNYLRLISIGFLLLLGTSAGLSAAALTITTTALPGGMVGTSYICTVPTCLQATGGFPGYVWSLNTDGGALPPGLSIASSGAIVGTPITAGQYSFLVQVTDTQNTTVLKGLGINISPCVPAITNTSPLPQGDVSLNYSLNMSGSGCSPGYSFTAQAVDPFTKTILPPGLNLSNSGVISGVATAVGTYNFNVIITDQKGNSNQSTPAAFSLTINALPTITNPPLLPGGGVGVPYSQTITATGGVPPYVFSMNSNPPGLTLTPDGNLNGTPGKAGTFSFNMGVSDSLRGQTVSPFQITFGNSVLQVNPSSLSFSGSVGADSPAAQVISIVPGPSAKPPLAYQVLLDTTPSTNASVVRTALASPRVAPAWLNVAPTAGNAPAALLVTVDQNGSAVGSYAARIRILDPSGIPTDVPVSFTVAPSTAPQLSVAPATLHFAARAATPGTFTQNVWIGNSGGGGPLGYSASVTGGSSWLNLLPSSGQTAHNAPALMQASVNTQGLQVGAYRDVIHVTSAAGSADIPVTVFIADNGPILGVGTTGVLFRVLQGDGSTSTRGIEVLDEGDPASTVNWTATLATTADWLNLGNASGTATPSSPGALTLSLNQENVSQLEPGANYALVAISDSHSRNSPQYVTVVLEVDSSSANPSLDLAPAGLFFTATAGGTAPSGQQVTVNTSSSSPVPFQVSASTPDNATWLGASPASGTASGQTSGNFTVNPDPTNLPPGIYSGSVNVSISGNLATVNVTFIVEPGAGSTAAASRPRVVSAGCAPAKLAITETGLVNNFAVPASWPATLITQLNDDCGASVTSGSVVASFSNGDAPLTLHGDSLGNYSATWQPGVVTPQMVVTLNATAGALTPAKALLTGGISQNASPPPVLAPNGTVNAFNRVGGGALSPGTIVEVYGSGLASATSSTGAPPLPITFNGTSMLVGGLSAPLFFLSTGQLDLEIPSELAPNQEYMTVISANGALSLPLQIDAVPLQPGVAAYADGHVIAQHANFTLVNAAHPAKPGEVIIIYLLGMGPTNPKVASGQPAPSTEPLARVTVQPTATVDSQNAKVAFAGLTPGYSGLYQIDFTVPSSANSGDLNLVVTQNGVASNTTKLPVQR